MKKLHYYQFLLFISLLGAHPVIAQQLLHYWNFNSNTNQTALLTPSQSAISGAGIVHNPGGISSIDVAGGTGQNFNVANVNARNGDPSGTHLRFNDPIGGELVFSLPTSGYENAVVKFATRRSGSGAGLQYWSYTTNGTAFIPFDTVTVVDGDPVLETLDFSNIPASDNNANFKIKVAFTLGAGGAVGNNRFDNFTMEGTSLGGPDLTPPVATFTPVTAAVNVAVSVQPVISFNEPVRLINNELITATNAASLVELRLGNASGAPVPFTTTFSGNLLTIIPSAPLQNNLQYYVALLGNKVEDFSDNAIVSTQSVQFTTIVQQTQFSAGDLVLVAYRMNATSTEDEIAVLTLVDILPGTFINFTDAKYTTNPQPQCSGGIVWTAPANECIPAGSILKIQTDAMTTNIGTLSGSSFGLSSGGDQVIVYTGTTANPNYVTALTSNGWVASNTSCGGSESMIPAGLTNGTNAVNLGTAPGNVSGNSANAYYNGTQTGTPAQLRTAILNPANWVVSASGTAAQTWPDYSFPSPPSIISASTTSNTTIQLIFNTDLDLASATNVNNYQGISGLSSATMTSNGSDKDTVTLTYTTPFATSTPYSLVVSNIADVNNRLMSCPYPFNFTYSTEVAFAATFLVADENSGTIDLNILVTNPSSATVDLEVLPAPFSTAGASDFTLVTQTINITGGSTQITIPIGIIDDSDPEQAAEYFTVVLRNPVNCAITGDTLATIYIKDNDRQVPVPTKDVELQFITSFDPSGSNNSTCEVVAYDPESKRLITSSAISGTLEIVDFSTPGTLKLLKSVDIRPYGGLTSVAVREGIIAVGSPNANEELDGSVLFFDIDGNFINQVTVGALPDMLTYTPDGQYVLVANEGQPTQDYSVDPEGSVSIIDVSGGVENLTQTDVTMLDFTAFNAQEASLIASGVRKTMSSSTLSQDLEPEYIAVSADGTKAWVVLQENNAIANIDLVTKTVTNIWPLGTKDMSLPGNGFDASDNNGEVLIANWPVKAYYIPDGMATYSVGSSNYLVTANEGDEKEYAALVERTTVDANNYVLESTAFPHAAMLKKSHNLGRMRVTNLNGDDNGDGIYDDIYSVGTRSFSIWDADDESLIYDSGDDFEVYTASEPSVAPLFNSDHESNSFKSRSRAKGPEPEGVTIATISGKTYAFIALERVGGVMVYDITDPHSVKFVDYKNSRSTSAYDGDHGAETLIYISPDKSPDGKQYVVVANEISGTLAVFEIEENKSSINGPKRHYKAFNVFPNPGNNIVYFNRAADIVVTNIVGQTIHTEKNALTLNVSNFVPGIYFIQTGDGATARLVVSR